MGRSVNSLEALENTSIHGLDPPGPVQLEPYLLMAPHSKDAHLMVYVPHPLSTPR